MEGVEKPKSILERAKSRLSYWLTEKGWAEREAHKINDEYERKKMALAGLLVKAFDARGLIDASSDPTIVPVDDPRCVDAIQEAQDAMIELRFFENEQLGMSKYSSVLEEADETLEVIRAL